MRFRRHSGPLLTREEIFARDKDPDMQAWLKEVAEMHRCMELGEPVPELSIHRRIREEREATVDPA